VALWACRGVKCSGEYIQRKCPTPIPISDIAVFPFLLTNCNYHFIFKYLQTKKIPIHSLETFRTVLRNQMFINITFGVVLFFFANRILEYSDTLWMLEVANSYSYHLWLYYVCITSFVVRFMDTHTPNSSSKLQAGPLLKIKIPHYHGSLKIAVIKIPPIHP